MFGYFGRIINPLLVLNTVIIAVISIFVGHFSNGYFGIAIMILSLLVVLTTPALRLKFFGNDWTLRVPVFPGAGFFRFALVVTLISAGIFAFMGDDMTHSFLDDFNLLKSRQIAKNRIKNIKAGRCYFQEAKKWQHINKTTGLFLGQEKKDNNGLKLFKFRLIGIEGQYNGPIVWVQVLQVGITSQKILKREEGTVPPSKFAETVILTSEQVKAQDLHRSVPDKLLLTLPFKRGDVVELSEDFSFKVTGDNPKSWLLIGGKKDKIPIIGNLVVLKKGTRFMFPGKYINFAVISEGEQISFSELKLQKIKNIL